MGLKTFPSCFDWRYCSILQNSLHSYKAMTGVFTVTVQFVLETCGFRAFYAVWRAKEGR